VLYPIVQDHKSGSIDRNANYFVMLCLKLIRNLITERAAKTLVALVHFNVLEERTAGLSLEFKNTATVVNTSS
jgi:hypothetical protein